MKVNEKILNQMEIIDFAGRVSDVSKRMGYSAGLLLLFLLSLTSLPVEAQSNIQPAQPAFNLRRIYVSPEGAGTFDGSSWANAAKGSDLQMILRSTDTWNTINSTLQIWVAAGTYFPTQTPLSRGGKRASVVFKRKQAGVYGGVFGGRGGGKAGGGDTERAQPTPKNPQKQQNGGGEGSRFPAPFGRRCRIRAPRPMKA